MLALIRKVQLLKYICLPPKNLDFMRVSETVVMNIRTSGSVLIEHSYFSFYNSCNSTLTKGQVPAEMLWLALFSFMGLFITAVIMVLHKIRQTSKFADFYGKRR